MTLNKENVWFITEHETDNDGGRIQKMNSPRVKRKKGRDVRVPSISEWMQALSSAMKTAGGEGMTTSQIREITGWSAFKILGLLRSLIREGRAECIRVQRTDISGRVGPVTGYRLKKGKK